MGFTEILLIIIVAILFLGPDKLPGTMVEVAKFIKGAKKAITDAKNTLNQEVDIAELKQEALNYKQQLDEATQELQGFKNLNPMNDNTTSVQDRFATMTQQAPQTNTTQVEPKQKEIEFKKKTIIEENRQSDIKKEHEGNEK